MKTQEIKNEVINALEIISKYPRMNEAAKEELKILVYNTIKEWRANH